MIRSLPDYFKEYSYGEEDQGLMNVYRRMWDDGYRLGEYGRYLRRPSRFQEKKLFLILKNIGFWKARQRWLDKAFYKRWSFLAIKNAISEILNSISLFGIRFGDGKRIATIAEIPGFGKRMSSVILTVMYPNLYGIIDYKVWRALNNKWILHYDLDFFCKFKRECDNCYEAHCKYILGTKNSRDFTQEECEKYFKGIRKMGNLEKMNPRQIDMALWECDEQESSYH